MKDGDISNVSIPYLAFDIELVWSVPKDDLKKVAWLELAFMYFKTREFYKIVPGSLDALNNLAEVYHILLVFVGPKAKWKLMRKLADATPYNYLLCVTTLNDLPDEMLQFRVMSYSTLLLERRSLLPMTAKLFEGWDEFKIAKP